MITYLFLENQDWEGSSPALRMNSGEEVSTRTGLAADASGAGFESGAEGAAFGDSTTCAATGLGATTGGGTATVTEVGATAANARATGAGVVVEGAAEIGATGG